MSFKNAIQATHDKFHQASKLHTQRWQGIDISNNPSAKMLEILHHSLSVSMVSEDLDHYRQEISPHLPWADDHFLERVGGQPLNPGVEHANWPFAFKGKDSMLDGKYNHSYMERLWPKYAGLTEGGLLPNPNDSDFYEITPPHRGIYHEYGDLADVVELLYEEPDTRQAYLPMWFPEDTGVTHRGRKPCSIGWLWIMRDSKLDLTYYIRSCDFFRHFRDDVYHAVRLNLWMLEQLRARDPVKWGEVKPGQFMMHITSLHMFVGDWVYLNKKK